MTDEQLLTVLEQLLGPGDHGPVSLTFDRELTAGANRRTIRLVVTPANPAMDPFAAVAQVVERDGERAGSTRSVPDEGAVVSLAGRHGVPVAEVLVAARLAVDEPLPIEVLVTREVVGETIPRRVLRSIAGVDLGGATLTRSCGRALAQLHAIDPAAVPVVDDPLPVVTAADHLDHLTERLDDLPDPHPTFRFAIGRLAGALPPDPPAWSLVHGDFRTGNLIVDAAELVAALDWELTHVGDPMEDLAWLCLRTWRFGADRHPVGGFGTLDDLRGSYAEAGGRWRQDAFEWWTMARTAWWGIGLAGQAAAFVDGRSESLVHAASGRRVVELEYDLLGLLASHLG